MYTVPTVVLFTMKPHLNEPTHKQSRPYGRPKTRTVSARSWSRHSPLSGLGVENGQDRNRKASQSFARSETGESFI